MSRKRPPAGSVVQFDLPTGQFAYARVLKDAAIAVYREVSDSPGLPPIGSRDFQFIVGVYDDVLSAKANPTVGFDPGVDADDDWPPPSSIRDPLSGQLRIYVRGEIRAARPGEGEGLEPAAVWDKHHIVDRIMGLGDDPNSML